MPTPQVWGGKFTNGKQTKPKGGGVLATERLSCEFNGQCPWIDRLLAKVSDQSPSAKWCKKQDCRNQVVQFGDNPIQTKKSNRP